jgi:hypothetical protein
MLTLETDIYFDRDGHPLYGKGDFTYNVEVIKQKQGFDWEITVPKQTVIVSGIALNWVTEEEIEFTEEVEIDPAVHKIQIYNKESIGWEGFCVGDVIVSKNLISLRMGA